MASVRFFHAAHLRLGALCPGVGADMPQDMLLRLHAASFEAWWRLIDLCIREVPDFLILSGSIYEHPLTPQAHFALQQGFKLLNEAGVEVFWAMGGSDPLSTRLKSENWPNNVKIFGAQVESYEVLRQGKVVAVVQGASLKDGRSTTFPAAFQRTQENCPHIGVWPVTPRKAPIKSMSTANLDCWAFGAGPGFQPQVASEDPLLLFPGALQPLGYPQFAEKSIGADVSSPLGGCLSIAFQPNKESDDAGTIPPSSASPKQAAQRAKTSWEKTIAFHSLAQVRWMHWHEALLSPDAEDQGNEDLGNNESHAPRTMQDLEAYLVRRLSNLLDALPLNVKYYWKKQPITGEILESFSEGMDQDEERASDRLEEIMPLSTLPMLADFSSLPMVIVRLKLSGVTPLDGKLQRMPLRQALRLALSGEKHAMQVWVQAIDLETQSHADEAQILARQDIVGETVRQAKALQEDPEALRRQAQNAWADILGYLPQDSPYRKLDAQLLEKVLVRAQSLCLDMLEDN